MGTEIERRFLIDSEEFVAYTKRRRPVTRRLINQAYLTKDPWVRVRLIRSLENEPETALLTIKGKGTIKRPEFNYDIPVADYFPMRLLAKFGSIEKLRYECPIGGHTWEVDCFTGRHAGVWLAEIELDSETTEFERPEWLRTEVTEDERYSNAYLAEHGLMGIYLTKATDV